MAPAPGFAGTATATETTQAADAGFALSLPETVTVLPEPSASAPVQTARLPTEPAAFAGTTPQGATSAVEMVAAAAPAAPRPAVAEAGAATRASAVAVAAAPDPTKVFPSAPVLVASAGPVVPIEAAAYSGPVPFYLSPVQPALAELPRATVHGREDVEKLIAKYASLYEVPVELVRHVVNRESTFNPRAYNHGHWGLMQIKHATARGMGYQGPPSGLFDAETNLKYAVKYLRGAWLTADRNAKRADWLYQTGYYYEAKRKGLLEETGLGVDRKRRRAQEEEVRLDPEGIVRPPAMPVGSSS